MNALNIQHTSSLTEEAKEHIVVLTELLRDLDIESRMTTLIKADEIIRDREIDELKLQSIRVDLERELTKTRKMVFMVERAQSLLSL